MRPRIPVLARIDFLYPVPTVDDLILGAEQTAGYAIRVGNRSSQAAQMADREVAKHFLEKIIQIAARAHLVQIGPVLCFSRNRVHTVIVRIVKEAALDLPYLVKHLPPLGARIHAHFHLRQVQLSLAWFDGRIGGSDNKRWRWTGARRRAVCLLASYLQQHLLPVE